MVTPSLLGRAREKIRCLLRGHQLAPDVLDHRVIRYCVPDIFLGGLRLRWFWNLRIQLSRCDDDSEVPCQSWRHPLT